MKKSTQKRSKIPSSTQKSLSTNFLHKKTKNHTSSKENSFDNSSSYKKDFQKKNFNSDKQQPSKKTLSGEVRLNRYISNCGICSRREADELIQKGLVKVNDKVVKELGTKIIVGKDKVTVNGKLAKLEEFVYILFNKPKNCITTLEDEKGRKTVMDYLKGATEHRIYPVGRLDRNTTGLLLFTNDGELAKTLSHPSSEIPKVYYAKLNKPISNEDIEKLLKGIELEDGFIAADRAGWVEGTQDEVGIEIHSGKNHIVKRMFQAIGYEVIALDRVSYGFLDKKGIKRGTWRFLTDKEVNFLKMNYLRKKSFKKNSNNKSSLKTITSKEPLDFVDEFEDFHLDEEELQNIDFSDLFNEMNEDFDEKEFANQEDVFLLEEVDFDDL